jgi:opacity protein-like surface antigen
MQMMKLAGICALLAVFAATTAVAQDQSTPDQTEPASTSSAPQTPKKVKRVYTAWKYELSAGFAHRSYYAPGGGTFGLVGWYASGEYNWKRWLGAEGEVTDTWYTLKSAGFPSDTIHIYTFLAGPRFYPLGHRKITPFGHVLIGGGHYSSETPAFGGFHGATITSNAYTYEVGGGLDLNLWKHWGVRMIQADFGNANYVQNAGVANRGSTRFSVGFVYHFGER